MLQIHIGNKQLSAYFLTIIHEEELKHIIIGAFGELDVYSVVPSSELQMCDGASVLLCKNLAKVT